jgi:response regulator RpfG family c-di-GMP phosphodiesterase
MAVFTPEEFDSDILVDLKEEILELYEASEQTLTELELTPNDNDLQRALFRSVHTIKGDLGLVGFTPMIEVLQYLEDILDMLRKGEIQYSSLINDLVMPLMDRVSNFVQECIAKGKINYDKDAIDATIVFIKKLNENNIADHEYLLKSAISALVGDEIESAASSTPTIEIAKTGIPKSIKPEQQTDLLFFRELMRPIEKRAGYAEGRGDKIASLALYINALNETPIAEDQLAVACYAHDFGMAFLPEHVGKNQGKLSANDQNLMRSHVYKSTRLLEHLTNWDEARKIIMQHHENKDGSGYPLGITGDQICEGAKLLAILDRYVNLTSQATADSPPMSEIEAVIAINRNYKNQLSGNWLRLFNQGMTAYLNQ